VTIWTVPGIQEYLDSEVADGLFGTGGQVYASVEGDVVVDVALGVDGLGEPVDRSTLFAVYCAGKPVVALAVGCLVDDGELSFGDLVGHVVDGPLPAELASLQISFLLDHTAGLHGLSAAEYMATPAQHHDELVASVRQPPGWGVGGDVAYSEVAAWHVLGQVIEALAGEPLRAFVRRRVLEPAGVESELFVGGMTEDEYAEHRSRLGINIGLSGIEGDPLLTERTRRLRCATNAAVSTSATARGLGRFYEALLRIERGDAGIVSGDVLEALSSQQSWGFDRVMGRECGYGYGFMVQLADHYFGSRCSLGAFGHSGNGGMTAAFADPEHNVVIAYHFNGRVDAESAVMYRRPALIDRIYRAILDAD
jgi:CubicO group peptidase (beta-lactamase class C family)